MFERGISLRWRIAILTALAITILSLVAVVTAYIVVRNSLIENVQRGLRADAAMLANRYNNQNNDSGLSLESIRSAPTGRLVIQVYTNQGELLIASNSGDPVAGSEGEAGEGAPASIPAEFIVRTAEQGTVREWRGELLGEPIQAAVAPFESGVIVVQTPTGFIPISLRRLAQSLLVTALLLVLVSGILSYVVASAAMQPITQLASLAAQVDPQRPRPLPYEGPNDEISQLSRVLNDLILRLKAALDAQRSFLAETSHELRTPLTSLQGFLERASRRADPDVQRDLADAKRISQTMSRLVADLLQLSRGELIEEMVPHLLDPYLDILIPVAEEFPGVVLTGEPGETLVGDPERLRQLIRNLTTNAVKATQDPSKVELSLKTDRDAVRLEVIDKGPGIPDAQLGRIFDKFYKGPGGGAGLGLAIAKQIAVVHQGELEVETEVGKGSTFRLVLPLIDAYVEDTLVEV